MVRNAQIPEMGKFAQAWASAVKSAVASAGVSGSELARRLDRAQSYVSLRLNGRRAWTLDELDQIARVLNMSVDELMERARAVD